MKRSLLKTLLFLILTKAAAQSPPIPVALVLSGGVSLGAYQAGYLYYSAHLFQDNPQLFDPKLITGTSAGGINSLLTVLSSCGTNHEEPQQSALWHMWVDLKGRDLLGPLTDHRALIAREGLLPFVDQFKSQMQKGLRENCDIVLGVVATRAKPAQNSGLNAVDLSRQQERFSLRIRGKGLGKTPEITNYMNVLLGSEQILLDLKPHDFSQNFDALRDLLFATSAFPLVFAPQKIKYCLTDPASDRWIHTDYPLTCKPTEIQESEFVDGGLFDNRPLALADRLARAGLTTEKCDGSCWREIPLPTSEAPNRNPAVLYLYFDNNAVGYPERRFSSHPSDLLPYLGVLLENFFNSSRDRDSLSTFELNPDLKQQIATTKSIYPRAGDGLLGFFGFFDHDLREYDFYLGMYEASLFFKRKLAASLYRGQQRYGEKFVAPEAAHGGSRGWLPFACLQSLLKDGNSQVSSCKNLGSNFQILAKTSLHRLGALCAQVKDPDSYLSCAHFEGAVATSRRDHFGPDESEFAYTLRQLAKNQYAFNDLGLEPEQAGRAGARIKTESLTLVRRLAGLQPATDQTIVATAGPMMVNSIESLPTEREAFFLLGPTSKIGASFLTPFLSSYPPTTRFVLAGQISEMDNTFRGPTPLMGLEFELNSASGFGGKTRLSLLGGYRFSPSAGRGTNHCDNDSHDLANCRGFVIQPGLSITFLERLKLSVEIETLPFVHNHAHLPPWSILPGIGLQFYL
jgi:predicted acylesterase/phospholipase RssA